MSPNPVNTLEAQMARWRSYLQDAPAPAFPRRQNLSVTPTPGALLRHKMALPQGVSLEIAKALVQLAWCLVSVYYSDTDDVVVGLAVMDEDSSSISDSDSEDSDAQSTHSSSATATATALPFRFTMNPSQTVKSCIEDMILAHDLPCLAYPSSGNLTLSDIAALGSDMANATLFENQLVIYTPTSSSSPASYEVQLDRAVNIECTLSKSRATIQAFYDDSILSKAEMQGVLHTFEHVFTQLSTSYTSTSQSQQTLSGITPISPKELAQVIAWNKDLPPSVQDTKHGMITRQAQATPDHEAVCALDLSLSYAQLETLSDNLAHHLITTYNIKPGQIVPFMFEKSPWTIPTLIAINKSGAAFAPLDPSHTWSDTSGILSTCEASLVVCSPLHATRFQSNSFAHLIVTPELLSSLPPPPQPLPTDLATPSSTAYVIFTSGSTGKPKGILCSHSAWVTHTLNHGPFEFHSSETRILQFSAYTWDVSISDTFTTLALGGTVCIPTEHERLNDLPGAFKRMSANHIVVTPTVGQFLRPEQLPTLKTLVTIGEQMPQDFVTIWAGKVNLVNAYGPSETISRCCCSTKQPGDLAANIGANVGAALWVTHSHDPSRLVPIGAIGELVVEGPILADGYLKNPSKTAEAFIPPPAWLRSAYPDRLASPNDPSREKVIYRTGDLVRQLFDGTYSYIGRRDTQIKVHGVRLEAGHIEAKIRPQLPHPDTDLVVDKIYVGKDESKLKQMLAAFITFPQFDLADKEKKHGVQLLSPEKRVVEFCANLHKYLVGALPSYMVPNYILPVSMIPLGATGKVNRRGLQAFARGVSVEELNAFKAVSEGREGKEQPRGEAEEKMAALWADVIGLEVSSIGREDSFFSLGGDSVSGMRLVSEAAKLGLVLSVADIFQYSVLHELAAFVSGTEGKPTEALEDIEPFDLIGGPNKFRALKDELKKGYKLALRNIEDVYPATPMQEGMMAESIGSPEAYILQEVLKLSQEVDVDRLEEALQDMVDKYPILRTRIVRLKELGTCQVVMTEDSVPVELTMVDNTDLKSFLAKDKSMHMGFGDVLSRFAVVHDILDGNRYFVWTAHHAITDGHMNEDIVHRLEIAYKKEEELPTTTEFNQFIKLQMENNSVGAAMDYWRERFDGFNSNSHFPPCEEEEYEPAVTDTVTYRATLPKEASKFTPSILLRAAWAYVLAQQASINNNGNSTNDIVMGITQSGRHVSLPGVEECLGPCLVTIPVRVTLDMTASISTFLASIQKEYIDAMPYQHTGLQHIRKASPECAEAVGFRNLLVVQPANAPNTSKLFLTDESTQTNADDQLNFGLFLECILSTNNTVEMRAGFDGHLLNAKDATLMMHRLEHIYTQLSKPSNANLPLSKLDTVSPLDMATLNKFNPEVAPLEQCMHWMIEEQARRRPNALMIDSWDAQLSYRVANEYSDRLAGVLFDLGVRPEDIIPFAFEKSAFATIAIHAILKAGGACVALDMAHPRDRHETVLRDTNARIIVTSPTYTSQITSLLASTPNSRVVTISQSILSALPPRPASTRRTSVSPANPAWVVYSSGSTGTPKGTILTHSALSSTSRTNSQILSVGPSTRAIHFASYSFDVAIEENTIIPMYGGCICIPSDEERLNDLPGAMRRLRVNWADLTPTVARMLTPENVPYLRTLVLGGESLTQDIIDTWATNCDLFNTYGPSECSIQCTSSLTPLRSTKARGANIGSPVNCKLWVVDAEDPGRLLPAGMTGELLIEGPILGRGYLNRPEKTKEVFISGLAWAGDATRRFYRTGDLARFNDDGTLDCLGRRDSQIKLNGQRVELGEIEYNIKKALALQLQGGKLEVAEQIAVEAFTPASSGVNGRKLLAAFVQFGMGGGMKEKKTEVVTAQMTEDVRQGLLAVKTEMARHVPEYMVPSVWVPLLNMPMNTSGKIDRKKLREEAGRWERAILGGYSLAKEIVSVSVPASAPVAPAVPVATEVKATSVAVKEESFETILARLWADVLGLDLSQDPIAEGDSFLELGGDSIAAMHLVGKAKAAGLMGLSVPTIMKRPTFGGMVAAVAAKTPKAVVAPARAPAPAPVVKRVEVVEKPVETVQTWSLPVVVEVPEPEPVSVTETILAATEPEAEPESVVVEEVVATPTIVEGKAEVDLNSPYSPFQLVEGKVSVREIMSILSANYGPDTTKVADVYPATPLQEGLMALTSADGNAYVLRDTYELPADTDIPRFKAAWNTVARQNAIFRTRILFIQGLGTCQVVMNDEPAIEWKSATNLDTYLASDREEPMNYGTKLARFAIVDDVKTKTKTFVWTIHHALYDGFSMALTFAAVDHAYKNSLAVLPSRPFVDFIRCLKSIDKKESDNFWTNQLKEVEAAQFPLLPNGHVCKGDNSMAYAIPFSVDRSSGITIATILKAAWAILVSRVSDSPDVVYGVTQFGRDLELDDIETINGPTITTVPVRITVDGKSSVRQFLERVQTQAIDMIPFSHAGLQNIKKISDATRAAGEFQNLLVIQPAEGEEESALFKKHTAATTADYLSGCALVVECALGDGEVVFSAHHDSTVISAPQVERLLHQFEHLLNQLQMVTGRIQDIDMFSPADRADLIAWNSNYPKVVDECVHDLIFRHAVTTPDAPAIASRAVNLTFKELDEYTNHLAHELQGLGIGPEKMVPICLEKSPEAIISMIAIQKAGGAYVPLNPADPIDRLLDLIDQVSASVVIFSEQTKHLISTLITDSTKIHALVHPPSLSAWPTPLNAHPVSQSSTPTNLAYALFTSGSTGRPKAVLVDHRTLSSSIHGHGHALGFADFPRRILQFASYTFDACIAEIFTVLVFGGCICIPNEHERMNDLVKFINDFKIDFADFTPSFVRSLKPEDVPTLKTVVLGGEAMNKECIEVWGDKVSLANGYGPTETCVVTVCGAVLGPEKQAKLERKLHRPRTETWIGHPVSSIGWVVDPKDHNRLTPVGCVGELLIQGPNVARGYLNNPEKTAEAFVSNPKWLRAFGHPKQETLYKTGDLVVQDVVDGTLTYLGRKDNQTKVNGQRLELGEIETQLKAKGASVKVESAVVLAGKTKYEKTKQSLAAFIHFSDIKADAKNIILTIDDKLLNRLQRLESAMRATLPKYMVPTLWIPVSKMPTLSSAKTDRKTLTALFKDLDTAQVTIYSLSSPDEQSGVKQEATTEIEKKLVELIARTLGRKASDIGTNDSFFRLGGDSITAIQLVASARAENITLSTELIFRHPKIVDMALAASSSSSSASDDLLSSGPIEPFSLIPEDTTAEALMAQISAEYSIPSSSITDILPCTPLQEGLITLTLKDPSSYILREIYRLPSKIDLNRFKSAWERVVSEHCPILRTRIVNLPEHGGAYQVVTSDNVAWIKAGKVQEYIDADKARLFGYGTPLARFGLVETQYTGVYFIWTMHHSVYDGWSRQLMMKLVGEAYRGLPSTSTEMVSGFNNFIAYLSTISTSSARGFWTQQFNGLEATASFPRIPASINSADFSPMLDSHVNLTIPLQPSFLSSGITVSTLLKAAYAIILSRYTSSSDTLFGLVQSGRNVPIPGIANIVGPTITTVPLRITVDPEQSVSDFLNAIQSQSTDMIRFEHTGLQNIARFGTPGCRDAVNFSSLMVIQPAQDEDSPEGEFLSSSSRIEEDLGEGAQLRYGLGLEISLGKDKIDLEGGYDSRLMTEKAMGRLLQQFRAVFSELATAQDKEAERRVGEINMVSGEDMAEMADMNASIPHDVQALTHEVIHTVALERSTAMAVNAWDVDFTYLEVDQLSTKLARFLREDLAVGPESIVPLCFEKSGWAVVAMLGVMKAGGAFVFLDPGYPMGRLDEIVRQVEAKVILASLDQGPLWKGSSVPVLIVDSVSIESLPSTGLTYESVSGNTGVMPTNALYLIFTSGSTGTPKGCVIEHHSFLTCARAQAERSGMTAQSRVLQGASYSFDVSVMEMLTALTVGACICVPNERIKKRSVVDVINDFRITWAFLTPSIVKFITPSDVPHLKTLILGGEALTVQNIATWAGVPGVRLINGYGPSECTIAASAHFVARKDEDPANIGKALGGICWIVEADDWNKLAPLGTVGELLVEGSIVARGYLNNPEKTAEVFVEDPRWAVQQDLENGSGMGGKGERKMRRMYRTGDLAYFNTEGDIMFVGRKDAQVKVRGQRMELGEIETHLTLNKNIQHAVVAYPKAGPCKKQLVGIVSIVKLGATTNTDGEVVLLDDEERIMGVASAEVADITRKLSALVPSYMIPEVWIVVQSFPLLLSGKLNRKRVEGWLAGMDKATHQRICGMGESIRVQAPSSEVEKKIHGVWVDVLKMPGEEIGVTQEFSTLGGDSILAMLVVGKLKALGFATVTMTDVANAKTISALAARIDRSTRSGNRNSIIQLAPPAMVQEEEEEKIGELFDLSPIQQFYAGVALGGDYLSKQTNKRFNHTFCLTVRRPMAVSTIKGALEALVMRHSMLRARFQPDETASCGWKQYVSSDVSGSLRFASWEDVSLEQVKPVVEQARLGLDIENGPLVSVDLVTTPGATEQYLMIVAHHLVVDLVSWNIILADLECYIQTGAFVSEPPTSFSSWLKHQQSFAAANFTPEKVFPLRSLPRPNFDYWDMAPSSKVNIVRDETSHTITLSEKDTTTLLTTTNKLHGAEPMDILVSTLSHAFSYVFRDRPAPTIFRYGHGREQLSSTGPDPSATVGWFTTFSPLHVSVRGRDGSLSVLQRTVELRKKLPHNGLAYFASRYFNAAGKKTFAGEKSAHNPDLMEITVNYLGNSDSQQRGGRSTSSPGTSEEEEGPLFDMSSAVEKGLGNEGQEVKEFSLFAITAEVRQGRLVVNCQWNSKMRRQDAIQKWWYEYENALRDVAYQVRKVERTANGTGGLRVPGPGGVVLTPPERSARRPSVSAHVTVPEPVMANSKQQRRGSRSSVSSKMSAATRQRLPSFSFSDYGDANFDRQMGQLGVGITVGGGASGGDRQEWDFGV